MIDFDALVLGPCMTAFGEPIQFMPLQAPAFTITAVYTDKYQESKFVGGDEVVDTKTMLGCQASQFPADLPVVGDQFLIRGRLWQTLEVIEDGHGHIRLHIGFADDQQALLPELPPAYT